MRSGKEHSLPENIYMGCPEHDHWVAWELPWHRGMPIRCGATRNFTLIAFSLSKVHQTRDHRNPICRNFENSLFRPSWPNQIAID